MKQTKSIVRSKKFGNTRGQMEIMGLAIVIVLVILGLLFVVRLRQFTGTSIREEFQETQIASNILNSILKTTSQDCYEYDMTALYQDCVKSREYDNPLGGYSGSTTCRNGVKSCKYVNDTLFEIFNSTLYSWNRKFEYTACIWNDIMGVCSQNSTIHHFMHIGCGKGMRERKTIPIPSDAGTIMIKLDLC